MRSGRYFFLATRLLLGALLLAASVDKILHPEDFAKIVHNYMILPDSLVNIVAISLPWLEGLLGLLLVAGFWLPGAVVLANALLLIFFSALIFNMARGIDVHCGCFSTKITGSPQTSWYLVRDSLFLLLGFAAWLQVFRPRGGARHQALKI
ncbi:MAG: DoxX family protein [Desulfobacteraceae bacterium]|nr:DoxX family protein [Desulfobacteraceae bacterium]